MLENFAETPDYADREQFLKIWKSLNSIEEKVEFLKKFNVENLRAIFSQSIDNEVFAAILEAWKNGLETQNLSKEQVVPGLKIFTELPKFSFAKKFLTRSEKASLAEMIASIDDEELSSMYA